jgi:hypothetical protein
MTIPGIPPEPYGPSVKDRFLVMKVEKYIKMEKFIVSKNTINGGSQVIYKFPNGRGASVVNHMDSYGGDRGLQELAVLDAEGELDYTTPVTDDVVGWLSEPAVLEYLIKIRDLPPE